MSRQKLLSHVTDEHLKLYALGLIDAANTPSIEAHLSGCVDCRTVVAMWQADLVAAVEALPAVGDLPPLRAVVSTPLTVQRLSSSNGTRASIFAAVVLVGVAMVGSVWKVPQRADPSALQVERQLVSDWMARADTRLIALTDIKDRHTGKVLIASSGQALFALPEAPAGFEYRAWVARHWHRGEPMIFARASRNGIFMVNVGVNDYLCLSLDRPEAPRIRPVHILSKAFF